MGKKSRKRGIFMKVRNRENKSTGKRLDKNLKEFQEKEMKEYELKHNPFLLDYLENNILFLFLN